MPVTDATTSENIRTKFKATPALLVAALALSSACAFAIGDYKDIDLVDLKLDIKAMSGKKVAVDGYLQQMGELVLLKLEPMDMTPIWLSIDRLSRDDRKKILQQCASMCRVHVSGAVQRLPMGMGVVADNVYIR